MSELIEHIAATIGPASRAQALGVEQLLARRGGKELGVLRELAVRLAAARHSPHPRVADKVIAICASDHGVADPGIDLGDDSPSRAAVRHVVEGKAAVSTLAASTGGRVVVVDCGIRGAQGADLGAGVIELRVADGSRDLRAGPALSADEASQAVQTGVALCYSLASDGLDVLALGSIAPGGYPSSAAITAAITGCATAEVSEGDDAVAAALQANRVSHTNPLEVLAALGSCDVGVLVGLVLGAASINVPVILDGHATSAAALIATAVAPHARDYLIASHGGGNAAHRRAVSALGLAAVFDLGLASGEGAGAAMLFPFVDSAVGLVTSS